MFPGEPCLLACCHPLLCLPTAQVSCPEEMPPRHTNSNGYSDRYDSPLHSLPFILLQNKNKRCLLEPPLHAYHKPHGAITPADRAHGCLCSDSPRSVMNIHVCSAARMIRGEMERRRMMNIELTCRAE